jgi:hypothetical protein
MGKWHKIQFSAITRDEDADSQIVQRSGKRLLRPGVAGIDPINQWSLFIRFYILNAYRMRSIGTENVCKRRRLVIKCSSNKSVGADNVEK